MKRTFLLPLVLWMASVAAWAQQRYVIYPVPQQQELVGATASVTDVVNIVAEEGIDKATIDRAREVLTERGCSVVLTNRINKKVSNLLLGINGSQGIADRETDRLKLSRSVFSEPKFDRHVVSLSAGKRGHAQLLVVGETTDAVFCGLATVEQMLDNGRNDLACVRFYDYADQRSRGVIEGYYGVPYNAEVTKDLFRFMARYKMNTYMYGAKSDPYHTRYWGDPYPTTITPEQKKIGYLTQDMLRDIVGVAHQSKVNFIWAIHPGTAFTNPASEDVIQRIMTKFGYMYDLGVRQFGLFVDDVGVPNDDPTLRLNAQRVTELQNAIDNRWNKAGQTPADTVKPLQFVPQLYAFSWVKPEAAERFFQSLSHTPRKVDIYITGRAVWTVPNTKDLSTANGWLGRETAWWWNYPCNDNDVTKLFPMDMYTNFRDEKHIQNDARMESELHGTQTLISNPMQQGEASKIALFSIADYAWNNHAFDNQQSWLASLPAVVGKDKAEALRRVAPSLRYFDENKLSKEIGNHMHVVEENKRLGKMSMEAFINNGELLFGSIPDRSEVRKELKDVLDACRVLSEMEYSDVESYRLFYIDIRPWLLKLQTMVQLAIDIMEGRVSEIPPQLDTDPRFQFEVLSGLGENIKLSVQNAEPSAIVLRPFIDWLIEQQQGKDPFWE